MASGPMGRDMATLLESTSRPGGLGSVGNPGLDFFFLKHAVVVLIGGVKIPRDSLEEFIKRQLPVFIAVGSRESPEICSLDESVLFNGQKAILVDIDEEKRLSHAIEKLDATDLAIPVLVGGLHDLF